MPFGLDEFMAKLGMDLEEQGRQDGGMAESEESSGYVPDKSSPEVEAILRGAQGPKYAYDDPGFGPLEASDRMFGRRDTLDEMQARLPGADPLETLPSPGFGRVLGRNQERGRPSIFPTSVSQGADGNFGYRPGARDVFSKKNVWWKLPLAVLTSGNSLGQRDLEMLSGQVPGQAAANRKRASLDDLPADVLENLVKALGKKRGVQYGTFDPAKKEWSAVQY